MELYAKTISMDPKLWHSRFQWYIRYCIKIFFPYRQNGRNDKRESVSVIFATQPILIGRFRCIIKLDTFVHILYLTSWDKWWLFIQTLNYSEMNPQGKKSQGLFSIFFLFPNSDVSFICTNLVLKSSLWVSTNLHNLWFSNNYFYLLWFYLHYGLYIIFFCNKILFVMNYFPLSSFRVYSAWPFIAPSKSFKFF